MTLALLIAITIIVTFLAIVITVLNILHAHQRKNDASGLALATVLWVAAIFSAAILVLYRTDAHQLSLTDILSFYGTIASVLASAYLGYVVYKIEKDEVCRNNSCCCIMNRISIPKEAPGDVPTLELRRISKDANDDTGSKKKSGKKKESTDEVAAPAKVDESPKITPLIPDELNQKLVIVGRGYTEFYENDWYKALNQYITEQHSEKQPAILFFSIENHGPAFLQNIHFTFDANNTDLDFNSSLILANSADHKCKWFIIPTDTVDTNKKVLVTFTSCYGDKTYADFKLTDMFEETNPGLFYSCKYYHYHGSKKPKNLS